MILFDFVIYLFLSGMVYLWYLLFVVTKSLVDKKMCQTLGLQTTIFLLCVLQQHHLFTKRLK